MLMVSSTTLTKINLGQKLFEIWLHVHCIFSGPLAHSWTFLWHVLQKGRRHRKWGHLASEFPDTIFSQLTSYVGSLCSPIIHTFVYINIILYWALCTHLNGVMRWHLSCLFLSQLELHFSLSGFYFNPVVSSLILAADQIAVLEINSSHGVRTDIIQSHLQPVTAIKYSSCFNQVVTACEGGVRLLYVNLLLCEVTVAAYINREKWSCWARPRFVSRPKCRDTEPGL